MAEPKSLHHFDDDNGTLSSVDEESKQILENQEIVGKYDTGSEGQEIDDWENNFAVYKSSDRYGFLHEAQQDNVASVSEQIEQQVKLVELKREDKWLKMYSNWDKYLNTVKLRRRIYKGIPDKFRGQIWRRLLQLEKTRNSKIYEELRERARFISPHVKQIDLDINRTYRNHLHFRQRYDNRQQSLFHVLAAYSMFNTEVGYCQGMSQVVALLLMYLDEEDAFWALHTLMANQLHAMHGFFIPGFPKLLRYQSHLDTVLKKCLSGLKKHFDKCEIHTALFSTKWFFQCFLDRLPFTLVLRVWDIYILDGERILIAMSYNILKMHRKTLLRLNFEQTMNFLQSQLEHDFGYSFDEIVVSLRDCIEELRRRKLTLPPPFDRKPLNETPSKNFGESLQISLEKIKQQVAEVNLKRSAVNSRTGTSASSTPLHVTTPRAASALSIDGAVNQKYPEHVIPIANEAKRAVGSPVAFADSATTSQQRIRHDAVGIADSNVQPYYFSSRDLYQIESDEFLVDKIGVRAQRHIPSGEVISNYSPLRYGVNDVDVNKDSSSQRYDSRDCASPRRRAQMRSIPSFYDNVDGSDGCVASSAAGEDTTDYKATEEEYQVKEHPNDFGGKTFTSQYTRTTRNITTLTVRTTPSPTSPATTSGASGSDFSPHIQSGPDNVTWVEISTEGRPINSPSGMKNEHYEHHKRQHDYYSKYQHQHNRTDDPRHPLPPSTRSGSKKQTVI